MQKVFILTFLLLIQSLNCFRETGHLIISQIAFKHLNENTLTNINNLLSVITPISGEINEYLFQESSLYADLLDEAQVETYKNWHFQNFLYSRKNDTQFNFDFEMKKSDSALKGLSILLKSLTSTKQTKLDDRFMKSINLRILIHIIQDIHQPLHTTNTMFDKDNDNIPKLVKGDRGGNIFLLKYDPGENLKNEIKNLKEEDKEGYRLHKFLDHICFEYEDITLPLNEEDMNTIDTYANTIINTFQSGKVHSIFEDDYNFIEQNQINKNNINQIYELFGKWIQEGIYYCKTEVYTNIEYKGEPSKEYIKKIKSILDQQMYLAGLRLSMILELLYSDDTLIKSNHIGKEKLIIL